MPRVNPEILVWARETAGYNSLADAAAAIKLNDTKKATGAERLAQLEAGEVEPSRTLVKRMSEKYRRPLLTFYLNKIPRRGERGEDFRRVAEASPVEIEPQLDALIRNVRMRHDLVRSLLEDEEAEPLEFVASHNVSAGKQTVAQSIIEITGFDLGEFRRSRDATSAFAYLRNCIESAGLFVLLLGDLGSHHSKINARVFRGYAISDKLAPFIVINNNDAKAAWSFTALHEVCHIWLGQTGVSGASHEARIERFCNDVAGTILLPSRDVRRLSRISELKPREQIDAIYEASRELKISLGMIAYQLLRNDAIDSTRYTQLVDHFYSDWMRSKERDPDARRDGSGPSGHVIKRHRLGPALINLARRSVDSGILTPTKASQLLGVKTGSLHALLDYTPA